MLPYKNVEEITSDGLTIRGWFIHQKDPIKHQTIVFMHENAGNIGLRLDYYDMLYNRLNVNIVTFAYRGYSESEGLPTEDGIKLDADAIVNHLNKLIEGNQIDKSSVFILGRSLGGAVAIHTVEKYPHLFRGAIIENTFTSISDMVDIIFFFVKPFKWLILRNHWTSVDTITRIENPMLFIGGKLDELVPYEMTLKLHDRAIKTVKKELYVVEDGEHNDTWYKAGDEYFIKLKSFMKKCMKIENKFQRNDAESRVK
jgi:abhydrolase domain-containing protein 13